MDENLAAAKAQKYKQLKEQFVSDLGGGTISEINYVTAASPAAILLWTVLQSQLGFFRESSILGVAVEFILTCLVPLAAITIYSAHPLLLNAALLSPALLLLLQRTGRRRSGKSNEELHNGDEKRRSKGEMKQKQEAAEILSPKTFLANYRGCMLIITCIAILAVDFRVFPRRFAKVETWGTSLMDLGVGSFVFSAGVVSARPVCRDLYNGRHTSLARRLWTASYHAVPLFVLGFIRLYSVKGLDYAEHVTEYGVHWNFFFTLAFLGPFATLIQSSYSTIPSFAVLGLVLSVLYETLLHTTSLTAFVLTAPRIDLFTKNREGVFSLFGYIAIFLIGEEAGLIVLPSTSTFGPASTMHESSKSRQRNAGRSSWRGSGSLRLLRLGGLMITLYLALTDRRFGLGLQVSRRLANLPYVLWVSAYNLIQLLAFWAIDHFLAEPKPSKKSPRQHYLDITSKTLLAVNRNGLIIFLLANLGTGLVNLTIDTIHASLGTSLAILATYIGLLSLAANLLHYWNLSYKF